MRADDNAAFLEATLPAMDLVYNLARRCGGQPLDFEDLVQETYLRALQAWRRRCRPERVEAWLATICLNLIRSDHRRRRRHPELLCPDPGADVASSFDTSLQALGSVDRDDLSKALAELSPEQRIAVVLIDLCGLATAEVCRITRSPRGTVLSRVHRGRKALAAKLVAEVDENAP